VTKNTKKGAHMCAFFILSENNYINIKCLLTVVNEIKSNLFPTNRGPIVIFL